ncbi:MAG: hypothetical protein AAGA09_05550 [Pseudomonadota bacterium]
MKFFACLAGAVTMAVSTSGCVVAAAAGAGYLIHDEATECDGKFDPLEKLRDQEDECN